MHPRAKAQIFQDLEVISPRAEVHNILVEAAQYNPKVSVDELTNQLKVKRKSKQFEYMSCLYKEKRPSCGVL